MIQNTYKTTPQDKPAQKPFFTRLFSIDRRYRIIIGFLVQGTALFLCMAFISHFLHGKADQSTIESAREMGFKIADLEIHNWLGLLGAISAYYFIFRWLGITAFFIPPLLYLIGHKLAYKSIWVNIYRVFLFFSFCIFWLNLALGYFHLMRPQLPMLPDILGGMAFELATVFNSFIGWGTALFLVISLIIFSIAFFNITSLGFLQKKIQNQDTNNPASPRLNGHEPYSKEMYASAQEDNIAEQKQAVDFSIAPTQPDNMDDATNSNQSPADEATFSVTEDNDAEKFLEKAENYDPKLDLSGYQYPPIHLLDEHDHTAAQVSQQELEQNKDKIVETLINFKIGIASIKATIGPTVTLYEIIPEAGIKISKIKNLEDDIALNLAALGIRIIAPIPGKGTIGIEVPNKQREMVPLRPILSTEKFMKSDMDLPIVLGKTIANEVFVTDLARMPHFLIAGATGQGKSVGLNVVLTSLIYKKHPSQLKLVLVDPKKVELSLYNKLERHFLAKLPNNDEPIITETKKVVYTLNSLCMEMDTRYELLKEAGARNIREYNEKFVKRRLNPKKGHQFLPYIVLVIDEFADMMMTAGKEIEMPIARLAQLARAIGIHLVLATQRPSVNVITGIIKANFPVRLSFRVTSKIDSRTILDTGGAEQLVGQGDMLLSINSEVVRLQCPFLDTHEVEKICDYIGAQQGYPSAYPLPVYEDEADDTNKAIDLDERDEFFEEAAKLIVAHQQGSTSLIQRKLKLGYNRAGRLIDQLEATGIVGPFEGSKAREVLVPDAYSLELLLNNLQDKSAGLSQ